MGVPLLSVQNLEVAMLSQGTEVYPVRGVTLELNRGEVLGLVGESGCGKSTTGLSIMRLLPGYARLRGSVLFQGKDLAAYAPHQMREIRGNRVAMIFQNPLTSLNPIETIGFQIEEAMRVHDRGLKGPQRLARVEELLGLVGIPDPRERMRSYPHECSGGMRQRIMIAMALANDPDVLIADEPTTALDVSIQAQILWLLEDLQKRTGMGMIYITHDLDVAASLCHRIAVMYAGQVVEQGPVNTIFDRPRHPYTTGLLAARPHAPWHEARVHGIAGQPPNLMKGIPTGCPFSPRCSLVTDRCRQENPGSTPLTPDHEVRCFAV